MFFGNRRNNYNKIIDPIEETSSASYSGDIGFKPSTLSSRQQNFASYPNETPSLQPNLSYLESQTIPSFQQGVNITINTGKNTPLSRSKRDHRWDHIEDLDQVNLL